MAKTLSSTSSHEVKFELATKHGTIGTVDLDFAALPLASRRYIIDYGIRKSLQDAIAACKDDLEAARGLFQKRLDALLAGTVGTRVASPANALDREVHRLASIAVRAILKGKGVAIGKVPAEAMAKGIAGYIAANAERLESEARENIDRLAKLDVGAADDVPDFLAELLATPEASEGEGA